MKNMRKKSAFFLFISSLVVAIAIVIIFLLIALNKVKKERKQTPLAKDNINTLSSSSNVYAGR